MKLFEKDYKAAATSEFERSVRDLEERDKVAQTMPVSVFSKDKGEVQSNLNFAERLNLITTIQADTYRKRILKAQHDYEHMQRTETRDDIVDGFENPSEQAERFQDMESYTAQIAQERAKSSNKEMGMEQARTQDFEPEEHTR